MLKEIANLKNDLRIKKSIIQGHIMAFALAHKDDAEFEIEYKDNYIQVTVCHDNPKSKWTKELHKELLETYHAKLISIIDYTATDYHNSYHNTQYLYDPTDSPNNPIQWTGE